MEESGAGTPPVSAPTTTTTPKNDTAAKGRGKGKTAPTRRRRSRGQAGGRSSKSRPANLAQMHLAVLKHMERCRDTGEPLSFAGEAVRHLLQDQSGSKIHHADRVINPCEANDPLRHILKETAACGAGTDPSVFRPDRDFFGVRMWPELVLTPILDEFDAMRQAWHTLNAEPTQNQIHRRQHQERQHRERQHEQFESLASATGGTRTAYAPARPLW